MTLKEHIEKAKAEGRAVAHFNISNMEAVHAIREACVETGLPIIIGVSEGEGEFFGMAEIAALVKLYQSQGLPIFLNADHSYSVARAKAAIDLGFDAVIYDGAELPHEENIKNTKEVVDYARATNPSCLVEAEIGFIGKSSNMLDAIPEGVGTEEFLTKPDEAKAFVNATGVDLLAPAVGNLHGMLKNMPNPRLDIPRIQNISETTGLPLVLHGGSGTSIDDFKNAIRSGVSIVHVNTELRVAYKNALTESLIKNADQVAPYKFLKLAQDAMKAVILEKLTIFNNA
jgi:fructose-bisphosphate aldolase, class II